MPLRNLTSLSDRDLHSSTKRARKNERAAIMDVIAHIAEIDRRRLYLPLGYSSLFDYCTGELKYSASAAFRRIRVARCIRRFPEVARLLERGVMTLTTVCLVAPILSDTNRQTLLARVGGKSQREVEAIVAGYQAPVRLRDRVRPVSVAVPSRPLREGKTGPARPEESPPPQAQEACEKTNYFRSGSNGTDRPTPDRQNIARREPARVEQKFHFQFVASAAFMKKYNEARAALSNNGTNLTFESVFEAALDELLERRSPARRAARRRKRRIKHGEERRIVSRPAFQKGTESVVQSSFTTQAGTSRHIPASIKDAVFARDGGRCTYVGSSGRRCAATHRLHLDHRVPYARGGSNDAANLRLLCAAHNRLEAARAYGERFMRPFQQRE